MSSNSVESIPFLILGLIAAIAAVFWWKRRQADQYDLRRLREAPRTGIYDQTALLPEEQPEENWVTKDSGPYCYSCDEAYAAGTSRCRRCGRPL